MSQRQVEAQSRSQQEGGQVGISALSINAGRDASDERVLGPNMLTNVRHNKTITSPLPADFRGSILPA